MYNINIPSGYHISKGATNDFYILNDGDIFIRNLSKNLSEAKSKAVELIKENDPDFFKDGNKLVVSIWNRNSWSQEQRPKWLPYQFDHIYTHNDNLNKIRLDNKKKELTKKYSEFSHIANVGDRLNLELTITEIFNYPIQIEFFPYTIKGYGHKFVDQNNNKLIYFGASKEFIEKYTDEDDIKKEKEIYKVGDKIIVKATIKEHTTDIKDVDSETQIGMPLTIIARPKINKPKLIKEKK